MVADSIRYKTVPNAKLDQNAICCRQGTTRTKTTIHNPLIKNGHANNHAVQGRTTDNNAKPVTAVTNKIVLRLNRGMVALLRMASV
jgi:hypothetical protein